MNSYQTIRLISDDSPWTKIISFSTLLIFITIGTIVIVLLGAVHQEEFGHDIGIFLDGAWRVFQGQRPHLDFHTPLGPVTLMIVAFAMKLTGPTANAIGYGIALIFPILTLWAWLLASRRMPPLAALLFSLFVGGTVASVFPFGYSFRDTSYAGLYNRIGYALLSLILIEAFLETAKPSGRRGQVLSGLSTGILIAALFFLKTNFFVAACIAVAAAIFLSRRSAEWVWGCFGGFLLVLFVMMVYLEFRFSDVLSDMLSGAAIRSGSTGSRFVSTTIESFAGMLLLFILWLFYPSKTPSSIASRFSICVLTFAIWGIYLFLAATNMVMKEVPLYPVPAFILLEYVRRAHFVIEPDRAFQSYTIPFLLTLYLAGRMFIPDVHGFVNEMQWRSSDRAASPDVRFRTERLAPIPVVWSAATCENAPYAVKVNDGVSLLMRHVNSESRVMVMDYGNLFSFALSLKSPRGDMLWWHYGTTFDQHTNLPAQEVFQDATIIMAPKCEEDWDTVLAMGRLYGSHISEHYMPVDETQFWRLLKK